MVAPFTGAWIEIETSLNQVKMMTEVAPFTGAWIEIVKVNKRYTGGPPSHPSRVRGLKSFHLISILLTALSRTLHGCVD